MDRRNTNCAPRFSNAKRELIHDHIEHCLEEKNDRAGQRATLKELKALSKYL